MRRIVVLLGLVVLIFTLMACSEEKPTPPTSVFPTPYVPIGQVAYDRFENIYLIRDGQGCHMPFIGAEEQCIPLNEAPHLYQSTIPTQGCRGEITEYSMRRLWDGDITSGDAIYEPGAGFAYPGEVAEVFVFSEDSFWVAALFTYEYIGNRADQPEFNQFTKEFWLTASAVDFDCKLQIATEQPQ